MESILKVKNVCKRFPQFQLNDISFELPRGFIMGLIGPNGAGKSTTIRMIMDLVRPDSGGVEVFGEDVRVHGLKVRQRVGYVYDESPYHEMLSPLQLQRIIAPFYNTWDSKRFEKLLKDFELPKDKPLKSFSKGMKMKFSLAVALSYQSELILMDEPTSGLDPVFRRELLDILGDVIQNEERSILLSSHITTDLERIADYITFIDRGKLIFSLEKDRVFEEFALVKGATSALNTEVRQAFVGLKETNVGFEGVIRTDSVVFQEVAASLVIERPSLEDIMLYMKKGRINHANSNA